MMWLVKHWKRLPKYMVDNLSLKIGIQAHARQGSEQPDLVSGVIAYGRDMGLDGFKHLFQHKVF